MEYIAPARNAANPHSGVANTIRQTNPQYQFLKSVPYGTDLSSLPNNRQFAEARTPRLYKAFQGVQHRLLQTQKQLLWNEVSGSSGARAKPVDANYESDYHNLVAQKTLASEANTDLAEKALIAGGAVVLWWISPALLVGVIAIKFLVK
jgi:hypothetical protein